MGSIHHATWLGLDCKKKKKKKKKKIREKYFLFALYTMPHGWGCIALKKKKKKKKIRYKYFLFALYTMPQGWGFIAKKNQKKYSMSPSVVHSIRASYDNAAMFSCKKSNL